MREFYQSMDTPAAVVHYSLHLIRVTAASGPLALRPAPAHNTCLEESARNVPHPVHFQHVESPR